MEETIMPSKSTRKRSTATDDVAVTAHDAAQAGDTTPVSAPVAGTPALPPTAPDTAATRGLWAALVSQPGSTAVSLANAAGISRPTAAKVLASLEKASVVKRTEGGREGSKRLPDQWQPVLPREESDLSDSETADAAEPVPSEVPVVKAEEPEGVDGGAERADGAEAEQPMAETEQAEQAATQKQDEPEGADGGVERADGAEAERPVAEAQQTEQAATPEGDEHESADSGEATPSRKRRGGAPAEKAGGDRRQDRHRQVAARLRATPGHSAPLPARPSRRGLLALGHGQGPGSVLGGHIERLRSSARRRCGRADR
jgi:hypothetical protein